MNITLLLATSIALNFNATFNFNNHDYQDFILFSGNDTIAHMFRRNKTILLSTRSGSNTSLYEYTSNDTTWYYTWPTTINGEEMSCVFGGKIEEKYDYLLFIEPVFSEFQSLDGCHEDQHYLYALILLILPGFFVPKLWENRKKFLDRILNV